MPQVTIHDLGSLPNPDLTGLTKGTGYLMLISRASLRVRLKAVGDAGTYGSVRPYYKFEGAWVPLRGDGDDAVSSTPCTAQSDKLNGWADMLFRTGGISGPVILVKEAGNTMGVSGLTGYLDIADAEG